MERPPDQGVSSGKGKGWSCGKNAIAARATAELKNRYFLVF
jgi:hypothetical protein